MAEEKRKIFLEVDENLDEVSGHLGSVGKGIGAVKAGILGMAQAAKAFIATPLGAILAAVAAVLAPLITYFTRMQEGMEKVRIVSKQLGAAFDVIIDRVASIGKSIFGFGKAIAQFFSGDIEGAARTARESTDLLTQSFKGMGDEIKREVQLAGELEKALIALEKAENDLRETNAKVILRLAELKFAYEDTTKSFEERKKLVEEAFRLEQERLKDQIALQKERLRIAELEFDRAESNEDDRKKLIEERVKLAELEAASIEKQIEIRNKLNEFDKAIFDESKKRLDETFAGLETLDSHRDVSTDKFIKNLQKQIVAVKDFGKERTAQLEKQIAIEIALEQQKQGILENTVIRGTAVLARIAGENTAAAIALNIASAIASTYTAANAALATPPGPPYTLPLVAVTIAEGLYNVGQILKAARSVGGAASIGGASFAVRGNPGISFTPEVVRRQQTDAIAANQTVNATVSVEEINRVQNRVSVKESSSRV